MAARIAGAKSSRFFVAENLLALFDDGQRVARVHD